MQPTDLNLNTAIESLLDMIRCLVGENISLYFIPGSELATVHADRGLIEQVLTNLCLNACDAMPNGGKITIETGNVLMDEEYTKSHTWASPGRCVLLSVTGTGCGMDKETADRIFEPFFTTKEIGKGTGLGLSMAYGIIQQHHGQINVYSESGKGSVFKIYLPSVERRASDISHTALGRTIGGHETILLAEDDESVLKFTELSLRSAGYTVLTAMDGKEALHVFEMNIDQIDLVMLDVMMPRMGGKDAFEKMKQQRPDLPHLFASGYSGNAVHTGFIQDPELHLLGKPYRTEDLLRKIRKILDS
jgi:CheY-like chemotaxis protein